MVATLDRMKAAISRSTGVDPEDISEDTPFISLCKDSMETIDVMLEIEIEFGIDIDEPTKVRTVGDAVALVTTP